MNRFVLAGAAFFMASQAATSQPAKAYGWHTVYDAARAEAKRAGKPIFLVFRCEP
jgi:hypothetical protein